MSSLSKKTPAAETQNSTYIQNHSWAILTLFTWIVGTGLYYYHFSFETFEKLYGEFGMPILQRFFDFFAKGPHNPGISKLWESTDPYGYFWALIITPLIVFGVVQWILRKKSISFWVLSYLWLFLWILWIVCIFTTLKHGYFITDTGASPFSAAPLKWNQLGELLWISTTLTLWILSYLALPLWIFMLSLGLGSRILSLLGLSDQFKGSMYFATTNISGFSLIITLIAVSGFIPVSNYSIWSFYVILLGVFIYCYRSLWSELQNIWKQKSIIDISSISWGFAYVVNGSLLTLIMTLVSINLINIVRPFPIGWDDLGVYMNFPKILASTESTLNQWMVLWQSFIGVGFLHGSATQAFFLNSLGGLLALLAIYGGTTYFLNRLTLGVSSEWVKSSFIHLPLLTVATFASMPMVIFQLAKDMKLDSGLLALSIVGLVCLFEGMSLSKKTESFSLDKKYLLLIAGILMGIAFTIKATTLMLMIGGIAALWYSIGRLRWLIIFLCFFVSTFTILNLWKFLNVGVPSASNPKVLIFCGILVGMGLMLVASTWMAQSSKKYASDLWRSISIWTGILVGGIVVGMSPWLVKNTVEVIASPTLQLSIGTLLSGDTKVFNPDYSRILSAEAKLKIDAVIASNAIGKDGKTTNEDLGRYFGYESGINNYIKLPFNLTFQVNQGNDFTDIGPLYLSLFAWAFIYFLKTTGARSIGAIFWIVIGLTYFVPSLRAGLTPLFSNIELPLGYTIITILGLFPVVLMSIDQFLARKDQALNEGDDQKSEFIVFLCVYILLFAIAAFGIVWYGILLYFGILCVIAVGLHMIFTDHRILSRIASAGIIAGVCIPYFIGTVLVQAWNNLPADLPEYRQGAVSEYESIFLSRPEYVPLLATLNLTSTDSLVASIRAQAKNPELRVLLEKYPSGTLDSLLELLSIASRAWGKGSPLAEQALSQEAKALRNSLYHGLLYPEKSVQNTEKIYRVGTFTSYYINQNRTRFYEDSLVMNLDTYLGGADREATIDNIEKLGLRYILMDLNAATIDRDPRRDLTRRFERLLDLSKSDRLRLIASDSLCLRLSLEFKNDPQSILIAGVNYDSISRNSSGALITNASGALEGISAGSKKIQCARNIANLIAEKRVTDTSYSFLLPFSQAVESRNMLSGKIDLAKIEMFIANNIEQSYIAAFEIMPRSSSSSPLAPATIQLNTSDILSPKENSIKK
jgi:hypothetical protein